MQRELDNEFWEKKDVRIARQSSWKNSCELVAAFTNAGFYKDKAEAMEDAYGIKNMIMDDIYKNMDASGTPGMPRQGTKSKETGSATDRQKKAVFAIIWGNNGNEELADKLTVTRQTLDDLTFEEASSFIESYGMKKQ